MTKPKTKTDGSGLLLRAIPVSKLESGSVRPASVLTEAQRRAGLTLVARSFLERAGDSQETNEA